MNYQIHIDPDALQDIQAATDWYNNQANGLGMRFQKQVVSQINLLKKNPFLHAKRYKDIRCMLIRKYPFLVHYVVNETQRRVEIYAVFHTSRNPKIWECRTHL